MNGWSDAGEPTDFTRVSGREPEEGLAHGHAERENIYTLGLIIILPDKTRLRSPSTKNSQTTHVNSHLSPLTPPARIVKNQSVQSIGGTEKYLGANRMIE